MKSENIGENIRKLREKRKFTQIELGRKVGVSGTIIGQYERGEKTPTSQILLRILLELEDCGATKKKSKEKCKWEQWEKDYVFENWGEESIPTIANYIGRTERSVELFAVNNGLGGAVNVGNYLTVLDIANILGLPKEVIIQRLIKKEGLPCRKRNLTKNQPTYTIDIDEFMEWLENNQDKWSSKKMERNVFGYEPKWLKLKREKDMRSKKGEPWAEWEERRCFHLMESGYSNEYIAEDLNRPFSNIRRKRTVFNKLKANGKTL